MAMVKDKSGEIVQVGTSGVTGAVEDVVNHPNHYAPNGVDSFMHMKDQMGKGAFDGFLQGNAIKYVQRYAFKGKPTEDLCRQRSICSTSRSRRRMKQLVPTCTTGLRRHCTTRRTISI